MSDLFKPKEQKPLEDLLTKEYCEEYLDDVLILGVDNNIYVAEDFGCKPKKIGERDGIIMDFCLFDNTLFDVGHYGINFNTLGEGMEMSIKKGSGEHSELYCVARNKDLLLVGGSYVSITIAEPNTVPFTASEFEGFEIFSICESEGQVLMSRYNGGTGLSSYDVADNDKNVLKTFDSCPYLYDFKDTLYCASNRIIYDFRNNITLKTRPEYVCGFFDHKEKLYDFTLDNKIYETWTCDLVDCPELGKLNAVISVPKELVEAYL